MSTTTAPPHPGSTGNVIAAVCSFFVPGLGQLVQARFLAAAFYFVSTAIFYGLNVVIPLVFLIPAVLLHIIAVYSAATFRGK